MPSGGKRAGAGRPPELSMRQRMRIGAQCERLWRREQKTADDNAIEGATRHVQQQWDKARKIPVANRKSWQASGDFDDYLDDVRGALQQDQGIDLVEDNSEPARIIAVPVGRAKGKKGAGIRNSILAQVEQENEIVSSRVDRCWKEFRSVAKAISEEK